MENTGTAFVLSGGGSLGAVQVGMLQALAEAGVTADMVIGASVGALNAAVFAEDPGRAGVARLAGLWRAMRRQDVFPLGLASGLAAILRRRDHLIEARALRNLITRSLRIRRIEEARIPLHIAATDILSGREVLLSSGDAPTALMASTAIPVIFPHVELDGRYLVDGAVGASTPIAGAVARGAKRILVLPTGMSCAMEAPPRSMAALALHVLGLQSMGQLDRDVAHFAGQVPITIVPPLCPVRISMFDFSQTAALIERAARQTAKWLADGGLGTTGPLHVPLAHHDHPHRTHGPRAADGRPGAGHGPA